MASAKANDFLFSTVTYEEFLELFRKETKSMLSTMISLDSTIRDVDGDLIGLDAKIPGGKFDSAAMT